MTRCSSRILLISFVFLCTKVDLFGGMTVFFINSSLLLSDAFKILPRTPLSIFSYLTPLPSFQFYSGSEVPFYSWEGSCKTIAKIRKVGERAMVKENLIH